MTLTPRSNSLATGALACFACALLGLIALHALRPDYELASHMISDYAVGRLGWLMVAFFLLWSVGILLFSASLLLSGPSSAARKFGAFLLGVTSVGLLVSAAYPTDLPGAPDTPEGNIHTLSFLVNVFSLLVAIPLLSFGLGEHQGWGTYRRTASILAVLVVLAFLLQFFTLRKGMPYGLTNRMFVVMLFAWFISTAVRLRTLRPSGPRTTSPEA